MTTAKTAKSGAAKKSAPPPEPVRIFEGSALAPKPAEIQQEARHWYWVGLKPELPMYSVCTAGICFPRVTESVKILGSSGQCSRTQQSGGLLQLSRADIERIADRLSRKVVRYVASDESGRQACILLTLPDPGAEEAARKAGRAFIGYTPRATDEPAARYLYCVELVGEQSPRPRPIDEPLPPSIEEAGLTWTPEAESVASDSKIMFDDGRAAVAASFAPIEPGYITAEPPNENPLLRQ